VRAISVPLAVAMVVAAVGLLLFGTCSATMMGSGGGGDVAMIVLFIVAPVVGGVLMIGHVIRSLRVPAEQVGFPIEPLQEKQKAPTKDTNQHE
jgi:hypothetical protein